MAGRLFRTSDQFGVLSKVLATWWYLLDAYMKIHVVFQEQTAWRCFKSFLIKVWIPVLYLLKSIQLELDLVITMLTIFDTTTMIYSLSWLQQTIQVLSSFSRYQNHAKFCYRLITRANLGRYAIHTYLVTTSSSVLYIYWKGMGRPDYSMCAHVIWNWWIWVRGCGFLPEWFCHESILIPDDHGKHVQLTVKFTSGLKM